MKVSYTAPGKIILSGEHSVVYTKPALVTAVDLLLVITIEDGNIDNSDPLTDKSMKYCSNVVLQHLKKKKLSYDERNFIYMITSDIPEGRGMGSSAAFCVAAVAALLHFYTGHAHEKDTINSLAYACEKYFHGMPSGVDVSASCFGGLVYYRKEFEFLKYISALNFKIPKTIQDHLILIDSGKPDESTREMVARVGKKYNTDTVQMEQTLIGIEKVTKKMVVSIVKEDLKMFTECIHENQRHLVDFGIVSTSTQELLTKLAEAGTGKVTGAGGHAEGSGLILFFIENKKTFEALTQKLHLTCIPFAQQFEGVCKV